MTVLASAMKKRHLLLGDASPDLFQQVIDRVRVYAQDKARGRLVRYLTGAHRDALSRIVKPRIIFRRTVSGLRFRCEFRNTENGLERLLPQSVPNYAAKVAETTYLSMGGSTVPLRSETKIGQRKE